MYVKTLNIDILEGSIPLLGISREETNVHVYNAEPKSAGSISYRCHPSEPSPPSHRASRHSLTKAARISVGFQVIIKCNCKVNLKFNDMHGYYNVVYVKMAKYSFKSLQLVLCLEIKSNASSLQEILLRFAMCR